MVTVRHVKPKPGDVVLLVGTVKGAFVLRSDRSRKKWEVGGPYFPGHSIYALGFDGRNGRNRIFAGAQSGHFGALLCTSDNFGRDWNKPETANIRFPEGANVALKQIWQILPGNDNEPDTLYCGVEPAALFKSTDAGDSWSLVRGLFDHPHRPRWEPGGGGQCLHTIIPDPANPARLSVAISTGGFYRSDDGGASWVPRNKNIKTEFLPDKEPEFGQCVHKAVTHPKRPGTLFLQHHWGLYRSDDGGDTWKDINKGVPSTFGFAMAIHPHDPDTVYIVPLESDGFRCTPEGKLRVYRTTDGGKSWKPLSKGLPQSDAFETVLRDGLDTDDLDPAGVYFGTRSGSVWGSADGGDSWKSVLRGLPAVCCVKAATIGGGAEKKKTKAKKSAKSKRGR